MIMPDACPPAPPSPGMRNAFLMFLEDKCHPPLLINFLLCEASHRNSHPPSLSLFEQERVALDTQEQQAADADDVDQLLQREMDAVAVKGGVSPLSALEADIQGTRAALLAALAEGNQEEEEEGEGDV